ncbi:MAG: lipopolysaccharide biosynthesis protein [Bacteroidales bacterium]|jgi:O-antigen/teichoic acid export membrane protein|nr:lipopolysaccharide biosynthesis protein [Bacteroidales bacterium]
MSLKEQTLKGLRWSFIDSFSVQAITFIVGVILARMIEPAEFGLLGYTYFFVAILSFMVDGGFEAAIIRKKDCTAADYNTSFFFNLGMGVVLYALLFLTAPFISGFFEEPRLTAILRTVGLMLIICSVGNTPNVRLSKKMDFKTKAIISIGSSISAGVIAIVMAFHEWGVWCLVWRMVLGAIFSSATVWLFSDWRPAVEFSRKSFKELFSFGYKVFLSDFVSIIYSNIYYPVIGKFFSATILGFYTRAENFSTLISNTLSINVQRVAYPSLATIQDNIEQLKWNYRKLAKSIMLITFSCMLGMAAVAQPLISILIGDKWLPCVPFLQLMCGSAMFMPLHHMIRDLLVIRGHPEIYLRLEIISKSLSVPLIVIGIFWGIEAMLIGKILMSVLVFFMDAHYASQMVSYTVREQLSDIAPLLLVPLCVSLTVWGITFLHWNNWLTIIVQFLTGCVLTAVCYEFFKHPNYLEMKEIFMNMAKKLKNE